MTNTTPITLTVSGNEKAVELREINQPAPDKTGQHRSQLIYVIRDGNIAEFRRDLGLTQNFKGVRQIRIPALLEHTVDELIGLAEDLRNAPPAIDVFDWLELEKAKFA